MLYQIWIQLISGLTIAAHLHDSRIDLVIQRVRLSLTPFRAVTSDNMHTFHCHIW